MANLCSPFQKAGRFLYELRANGPKAMFMQLWHLGEFNYGVLKGVDQFGNKYYENTDNIFLKDRWVVYKSGTQWDGSQVPPEWHIWMHRFKDSTPVQNPLPDPIYREAHRANPTGTAQAYFPPGHVQNPAVDSPASRFLAKRHESWRPRNLQLDAKTGRPVAGPAQLQ